MITLPIEIGDTVLGGRFKNKKIIVREIGTDEYGSPTINGRSILKVRMPKLYMKENTMIEQKLEKIVRKIIKESLMERDITDPKVAQAIEELNDSQTKLLDAIAQIEALKEKLGVKNLEKQIKKLVDVDLSGLLDEMKKDDDRVARTKNVILNVSKWHTERENYSYEKVLDFAMTQVNQDVKFKILEELKATQTITKVKGQLTFAPRTESTLTEENIFSKIGNWLSNIVSKLKLKGNKIDSDLNKLERIVNKK